MTSGTESDPSAAVIWSEDFLAYKWAYTHPMNPVRLALTMSLARGLGVLDGIEEVPPSRIDDSALTVIHGQDYIDAVRAVGSGTASLSGQLLERLFGLGSADNPVFNGMRTRPAGYWSAAPWPQCRRCRRDRCDGR